MTDLLARAEAWLQKRKNAGCNPTQSSTIITELIAALRENQADAERKLIGAVCHKLAEDGICGHIAWIESTANLPDGTQIYAAMKGAKHD